MGEAAAGAAGVPWILRGGARPVLQGDAVCAWALLAVLSLVPGVDRPHTGLPGNMEHVIAYLLAAGETRLALRRITSRRQIMAFSAAAAFFEICQIWIPGRHAGLDNWAASSLGALAGILLVRAAVHRMERRGGRSAATGA